MNNEGRSWRERGNALVIGIVVLVALAGLAIAFMETSVWQSQRNVMAGQSTRASYIAEAGVNHAIADLQGGGDGCLGSKASLVPFGDGGYWTIATSHGSDRYTVTSVGVVAEQMKAVEVVIGPEETLLFKRALFGHLDLGAKGSVFTDSYESDQGTYDSQATNTHPETGESYAGTNGSLGSNGNITIRGGCVILGNATPGPGKTVTILGGSYVDGSTAPAEAAEPFPPVVYEPPIPSTGDFNTTTDQTLGAGTYHFSSFTATSDANITCNGDVFLYVDGDFSMSGQSTITVGEDSSLIIYHAGEDFFLGGGGMINKSMIPAAFRLYSTGSKVTFAGNSTFYGVAYAPNAQILPSGTTDIFGSFVGMQIEVDGATEFHYDELLAKSPDAFVKLKIVSWRKIDPATVPDSAPPKPGEPGGEALEN